LDQIPDIRLTKEERKLKHDHEQLYMRIRAQKLKISLTVAACLPIASVLNHLEVYRPWLIVCVVSSLRLLKMNPIIKVFNRLKKRNLNMWRIAEVITYYYFFNHYFTCLLIANAAFEHDARDNMLRRIPVPQATGIRSEPSVFTDMSCFSVYVNMMYFIVNTFSHVAIGDVTSVTTKEKAFNSFLVLCGTFIYCLLFGNITAIVASIGEGTTGEFNRQYKHVKSKLKNASAKNIVDVNLYFDYQYSLYQGLNFD